MIKIKGPGESAFLLLQVIQLLDQSNLSDAVIGAFAASFYGQVRATRDADAVISCESVEWPHGHGTELIIFEHWLSADELRIQSFGYSAIESDM